MIRRSAFMVLKASSMVLRVPTFAGVVAVVSLAATAYAAPTPLIDAIKAGNRQAARAALKQTRDVNTPEADGTTALHWAVRAACINTVSPSGSEAFALAPAVSSASMAAALPLVAASIRGVRP